MNIFATIANLVTAVFGSKGALQNIINAVFKTADASWGADLFGSMAKNY